MDRVVGKDSRITWHHETDFGRTSLCVFPGASAPSGSIGRWGECIARDFLIAQGLLVVRHAVFRLHNCRLVADLYHPPSQTVFEVKTRAGNVRPNFLPSIGPYLRLKEEGLARRMVCVHVRTEPSLGVSDSQRAILLEAGLELVTIIARQ